MAFWEEVTLPFSFLLFNLLLLLKGKLVKGTGIRKALVMAQFGIVIFVLTCTGMIYNQLQFLRHKDLGFDQEHMIRITLLGEAEVDKADILKTSLLSNPNIKSVATSSFTPGLGGMIRRPVSADNQVNQEPQFSHVGHIRLRLFYNNGH